MEAPGGPRGSIFSIGHTGSLLDNVLPFENRRNQYQGR